MASGVLDIQALLQVLNSHTEKNTLGILVEKAVEESKSSFSVDNLKSHWEHLLKDDIFTLAGTEGMALKDPETNYYNELRDRLDLILAFTEHGACEHTYPLTVLQDLLETQTVSSCSHIFSWIEEHAEQLTEGMVPQKGKALILLRTLNDLLRRLSKMGSTTIFCGRILTFLSGVFPLGERSGVNLRGEYGPMWEGVKEAGKVEDREGDGDSMDVDGLQDKDGKRETPTTNVAGNDDFYTTFWSLQLPFSRPSLFANSNMFDEFKNSVNKVLPVIKEATVKERAMMGNRSLQSSANTVGLKRKRDVEVEDEVAGKEYFFAKFLTSRKLLDLEIADTHFRRQFLFQLLILLNHLLAFTKHAKAANPAFPNRSLQMDFTLEPDEAVWVQETISKTVEELRSTRPNGRPFAETVDVILEREKNWVKWKNDLCPPFDKGPWVGQGENGSKQSLEEATYEMRKKMREDPKEWEWKLGSAPLTEIWDMGFRELRDLESPFQPGDVKDFVKKVKMEDSRIELRKKYLSKTAERLAQARAKAASSQAPSPVPSTAVVPPTLTAPTGNDAALSTDTRSAPFSHSTGTILHPSLPAKPGSTPVTRPPSTPDPNTRSSPAPPVSTPAPPATVTPPLVATPALPPDEQIMKYEENKQRWSWLALRTARDQYLQHFHKIGTGDIILLAQEIEKEMKESTILTRNEGTILSSVGDDGGASPMVPASSHGPDPGPGLEDAKASTEAQDVVDGEGDVKMEER